MLDDYTVIRNHMHRCLTKHTQRKASQMSMVYGTFLFPIRCQTSVGVICNDHSSHHNEMNNRKGKLSSRGYKHLATYQPPQPLGYTLTPSSLVLYWSLWGLSVWVTLSK